MPTTSRRTSQFKFQQLSDALRRRIAGGELPVGARVPPARELSAEWGVSIATAFRSIRELTADGLVAPRSTRQGTVVIRQHPAPASQPNTLACLLRHFRPRNERDNFGLEMLEAIHAQISQRGYRFIYHNFSEDDYEQRLITLSREPWIAGVLLDERTPAEMIERLVKHHQKPVVIFNRIIRKVSVACVSPDYRQIGREAFHLVRAKGYKRFVCWPDTSNSATSGAETVQGFLEAARLAGVEETDLIQMPTEQRDQPLSVPEAFNLPYETPADWRPTAFCAGSDARAVRLIHALRQTDLTLGEEVGVVGCRGLAASAEDGTRPTTWHVDAHDIGVHAVNELIDRIEQPMDHTVIVKLPARFIDRGTA